MKHPLEPWCSNWLNHATTMPIHVIIQNLCQAFHSLHPRILIPQIFSLHPPNVTIHFANSHNRFTAQTWHVISIGKIAGAFTQSLLNLFHQHHMPLNGIAVVPKGYYAPNLPGIKTILTSHPQPTQSSVTAAKHVIAYLQSIPKHHGLILFISGGGSAALEFPKPPFTIKELQRINQVLLASGASIHDINNIRSQLSHVKAGSLVKYIKTTNVFAVLYSDVPNDSPQSIASGPFYPTTPQTPTSSLLEYLKTHLPLDLFTKLTNALITHPRPPPSPQHLPHYVIASNTALRSRLSSLLNESYPTFNYPYDVTGPPQPFLSLIDQTMQTHPNHLLLFGGEITPTLSHPTTPGGRCTHIALLLALQYPAYSILTIATDGVDGTSQSSGALILSQAITSVRKHAVRALHNFKAAEFLRKHFMLLPENPTGLNFMDLYILIPSSIQLL